MIIGINVTQSGQWDKLSFEWLVFKTDYPDWKYLIFFINILFQ